MADAALSHAQPKGATGVLVLADGTVVWGRGFGATGSAVGEVCFNTAMTGYQEVMTDPSYAAQIVTFTFPHIGNVGVNDEDLESAVDGAVGCVVREDVTAPSNFRARGEFGEWLAAKGKIGLAGIDTRALTRRIRLSGAPNAVIAHDPEGRFDIPALIKRAQDWPGLEGMDLARVVSRSGEELWEGGLWTLGKGYARSPHDARPHVVAIDYGAKDNIFRNLVKAGARVTVVPAQTPLDAILAMAPDGVFLSNGPGDPAATGAYAVPTIQGLLERDVPLFGICLGHQIMNLALGAQTFKLRFGHHGGNHPVRHLATGKVEITSQNHNYAVDASSVPAGSAISHLNLNDGDVEGIRTPGARAFSVQYHPEAGPGPHDARYLFREFTDLMRAG
ncbi:MAG TPA: glutamine-hydrolyzing carbamoyl-phosphate synthase small subunit [Novosphingobium sp.]